MSHGVVEGASKKMESGFGRLIPEPIKKPVRQCSMGICRSQAIARRIANSWDQPSPEDCRHRPADAQLHGKFSHQGA